MLGKHTIKTWSTTQSSVSFSSGEAEFNGVVRGAGMGLGSQSLMRDLRQDAPVRVFPKRPSGSAVPRAWENCATWTRTPCGSSTPSAAAGST